MLHVCVVRFDLIEIWNCLQIFLGNKALLYSMGLERECNGGLSTNPHDLILVTVCQPARLPFCPVPVPPWQEPGRNPGRGDRRPTATSRLRSAALAAAAADFDVDRRPSCFYTAQCECCCGVIVRSCLGLTKNKKNFKTLRHIDFYNTYMKH